MKFRLLEDTESKYGIFINDSKQPFTDQILDDDISKRKTIETRPITGKNGKSTLDALIGKRVAIIRTGKGASKVVGYVDVVGKKVYNTKDEFDKDVDKHLVSDDSNYSIDSRGKVGYILDNPERVKPFIPPKRMIGIGGRSYRVISEDVENKNYVYNQKQTEVGHALKTLKGSSIKRSTKYGVGKEIGGQIYAHKDYMKDIVPSDILDESLSILNNNFPEFKYNCFNYAPKTHTIMFQEGPDFDTAREPVVGNIVKVNVDSNTCSITNKPKRQIWHHKWLWVKNDYNGFDVAESWEWSKLWLSTLTSPADGSNIENWERQLEQFGLE